MSCGDLFKNEGGKREGMNITWEAATYYKPHARHLIVMMNRGCQAL